MLKNVINLQYFELLQFLFSAHEVLSDEKKRKIYDRYGDDGLKDQAGFDSSSFDFNVKDFFKDFHFDFGKNSFFNDDDEDHFGDSFFGSHFEFHNTHHNKHHHGHNQDFHNAHHQFHHNRAQNANKNHHHHGHDDFENIRFQHNNGHDLNDGFASFGGFDDDFFGDAQFFHSEERTTHTS